MAKLLIICLIINLIAFIGAGFCIYQMMEGYEDKWLIGFIICTAIMIISGVLYELKFQIALLHFLEAAVV